MNSDIEHIFGKLTQEKHYVPNTISVLDNNRTALNVTAGQNANWTYANFFILDSDSPIQDYSINEGQYVVIHRDGDWGIWNSKKELVAEGLKEMQSFVKKVSKAESLRINYLNDNKTSEPDESSSVFFKSPQIIFYGAPGTGKSHKIKKHLKEKNVPAENIFRTTFHPDSDYSTFVGAYKPSMEKPADKLYTKDELISKLTKLKEQGMTYAPQKFGAKYWKSTKKLSTYDKKDILTACGMSDNYTVEIDKGAAVGEEMSNLSNESRIIYSFRPQAFLQAYIKAYQKPNENVYLIIEEINRGNCAQIFGDLFQLLDRNEEGKSEYTIKADTDLKNFLIEELGEENEGIKGGELCLPSNLFIYATMNTSDQSLFPIDSAFKRRWDWEYEPIKYINKDWMIQIGDKKYSWVKFQKEVNSRISHDTGSEDKMMGDFFVNPHDKIISKELFLNKILFYLWNDVCKDGDTDIFPNDDFSFSNLYEDGNSEAIHKMMKHLDISPES